MPPSRRATIKDIAHAAGLSTAAVSQALRPHPKSNIKLQQETIERVKRVAAELNYQPHAGARSIRSNSFDTIGYFAAKTGLFINSPAGYLAGVHDIAEGQRSRITLIRLQVDTADLSQAMPTVFSERNLDALVIESYSELARQIYERVQASRLPVIFLNDRHETNSVYVDDEWAAGELTRHLIEKGYKRIGFLHRNVEGGPPVKLMHHSAVDRENGYRKAMRKAKLPATCHPVTIKAIVGFDVEMSAEDWEVISGFDAVVAYDDDLANLVGRAAYDRGVRVPDSLAIASFNGDYASLCAWQRLTTMQIPAYEMGKKAAEMAFELFREGVDIPSVSYRPTLLVGQTT
ncbi:LacI family transcriptional regulator [Luteolibacter flavescens]|uniref:LacI family transcriptional regulator n=1 Tax=Luteolibacter flavescens TaxID=1859460 RepID=A0ABT3FQV3_9BACT|nr:LacI family DNA-binding transcriptional regulator [Luteolibacter flavescens]MCW1885954.1 LacI family transcriptional regulator [Luteolibacter flavescens]